MSHGKHNLVYMHCVFDCLQKSLKHTGNILHLFFPFLFFSFSAFIRWCSTGNGQESREKSCGKDMQKMVWVRLRAEPLQQPSALSHLYSQVSYSDTHASKS